MQAPSKDLNAATRKAGARIFTAADFCSHSAQHRARVEALIARGISIDAEILTKIQIPIPRTAHPALSSSPPSQEASVDGGDGARREEERDGEPRRDAVRCCAHHVDQLKSLADGHVQLHPELFRQGLLPAIRPDESLARVG